LTEPEYGSTFLYMAGTRSRVLKFEHPLTADLLVPGVIDALNGNDARWRSKYDRDGLIKLVQELQKLEHEWSTVATRFQGDGTGPFPSKAVQIPWRKICSILHQYTASPSLTLRWPQPEAGKQPDATWKLEWSRADGQALLDLDFALDALEIFKAGKISSLKQCEVCGNWFLARFPHQKFCSAECKDRFHTTNEADKTRRREWARANYQSRKELELGSRKAAKAKGGKK
jgi:hypothetical protein